MNWFAPLISICHAAVGAGPLAWPLALLLFVSGLLGSLIHCGPMCGAFVLAQASDCMACIPAHRLNERSRLLAGSLPLYHLGRITTYGTLGALAGAGAAVLERQSFMRPLSGALLLGAAVLMALHALNRWFPALSLPRGQILWNAVRPLARRLRGLGAWRYYATGVVLGFLPCGMLGAALLAAAAAGSPARSALAMAAFGLGTVPLLACLGIMGGRGLAQHLRPGIPWLFLASAFVLGSIGISEL